MSTNIFVSQSQQWFNDSIINFQQESPGPNGVWQQRLCGFSVCFQTVQAIGLDNIFLWIQHQLNVSAHYTYHSQWWKINRDWYWLRWDDWHIELTRIKVLARCVDVSSRRPSDPIGACASWLSAKWTQLVNPEKFPEKPMGTFDLHAQNTINTHWFEERVSIRFGWLCV